MYGGKIYTPTGQDSQKCFEDYIDRCEKAAAKNHQLKPGENVRQVDDGRVQVSGQVAVMEINGLLVKTILDKNPEPRILSSRKVFRSTGCIRNSNRTA